MKGKTSRTSAFSLIFLTISIACIVSTCSGPTPTILSAAPTPIRNPGRTLGNPTAPVIVEVFMDFQCPACKNFAEQIAGQINQIYVETGKVYYVFRHFPFLDDSVAGNESDQAANASMCADEQNQFWEYHDILFAIWNGENQNNFTHNRLLDIALGLGLDVDKFSTCFIQNNYIDVINSDIEEGRSLGVKGTPAILINRKMITPGFVPSYEEISNAIDAELAQSAQGIEVPHAEIEPPEISYTETVVDGEGTGLQPQEKDTPTSTEHVNTVTVGFWEIALIGTSIINDFNGTIPEEGHKFIALNLNLLNRTDSPQRFWPGDIGAFKAIWDNYTYREIGFDSLEGYIPPGWPISVKVIFDLPAIVEDPIFTLTLTGYGQDPTNPILLSNLGSQLDYEPPVVKNLGEKIEIPDYLSITPTGVRSVLMDSGNINDQYAYLLDTTIRNLYGHDISVYDSFIVFQLFSEGSLIPITWEGFDKSPWFSPPPTISYDPSEHQLFDPIAPGFVKEGSFQLDLWDEPQLSRDMLLLIYGASGAVSDWALYKLGDNATDLLNHPISSLDNENIALIEAQKLLNDGNFAAAAVSLGNARIENPGNETITSELIKAQTQSGLILSRETNKIFSRPLGSEFAESKIYYELLNPEEFHHYDLRVSPNGNLVLILDGNDKNKIRIVDLSGENEFSFNVDQVREWSGYGRRFLSWSTLSNKFLLLDEDYMGQNFIIVDVDGKSYKVFDMCSDITLDGMVAWSPDENRIAFISHVIGHDDLLIMMNIEMESCQTIFKFDNSPRWYGFAPRIGWSSDGNEIYFAGENALNEFHLDDQSVESHSIDSYDRNIEYIFMEPGGRNLLYTIELTRNYFLFDTEINAIYEMKNELDFFENEYINNWVK